MEFYLKILVPVLLGILAYFAKFLDPLGAFVAVFFAVTIMETSGPYYLSVLLIFFVVGSLFTSYKKDYKRAVNVAEVRGVRGINPVVANGIVPTFFSVLGNPYLLTGALSAALADTLATEIGVLHKKPVMIHTRGRSRPGTRGAISWLGEVAAVAGASIMALSSALLPEMEVSSVLPIALIAGLGGCNFDSLLGATMRFLSKHEINIMATLAGASISGVFLV